jgi:hypothetical protein
MRIFLWEYPLSVVAKLSSKQIKSWLENETGSVFIPVHSKAQKLADEMRKALRGLAEASKMLLDNSGKEVDKKSEKTFRRARALNKLARLFVERIQRIKVPEEISYDDFNELVQETQKALLVIDVDIRNWFPRISPFFIIDRRKFQISFERTKETLKDLSNFLNKEYVKTKTLEETYQLADKLLTLEQQLADYETQKMKSRDAKLSVEKEITGMQQEIAELKSKGSLNLINRVDAEIQALDTELKHSLQHLQKPFIKLQSLALRGGGSGLMQEESAKLSQYLEDPFDAFVMEQTGYPLLRAILEKLDRSMSEKLNLKPEKERKAKQAIDSILHQNFLADLHQKCLDAAARKKQLLASVEVAEEQANLSKLQEHLETLERKKKVMESEEAVAERAYGETLEKIRNAKRGIEKNVFDFMDRKISVE